MKEENTFETIHRYLHNDMAGDEKSTFEKEMASNDTIKNSVAMEKRFLNILDLAADSELKSTITSVHQGLKQKGFLHEQGAREARIINLKRKKSSRMLMAIAASFVVVMAAWFIFNNSNTATVNTDVVYADSYRPDNTLIDNYLTLDGAAGATSDLALALDQYRNKEYGNARDMLLALQKESTEDEVVNFYLALSHLGLNDYNSSIDILIPVTQKVTPLQNAAKWYLGLTYIKTNDIEAAQDILTDLENSRDEDFSPKAKELLKEIR